MDRQEVMVEGATISVVDEGDGPPVVLVPGLSMSIERWVDAGYVTALVDAGRRVVAMDPLGHGESSRDGDPAAYEPGRLVDHIVAVLDARGLPSAALWGYSRGAQMAGQVARAVPDRVDALVYGGNVLFDTRPVLEALGMAPDPAALEAGFQRASAGDWGAFWEHFPLPIPDPTKRDIEARNHLPSIAAASRAGQLDPIAWQVPHDVRTLAVWGSEEIFHGMNEEAAAEQGLDHATVPGGHAQAFDPAGPMLGVVLPWLDAPV
ncbi:MAG: alpha/beta fold hydrolase [Actinomycetota bacterium]